MVYAAVASMGKTATSEGVFNYKFFQAKHTDISTENCSLYSIFSAILFSEVILYSFNQLKFIR